MDEAVYLYNSKSPAEYISRSLEIKISSGKKAGITNAWLRKTGFTIHDIQYARNRNPHWKKRKLTGSYDRNRRRIAEYAYSSGERVRWTEARLYKFIEMTERSRDFELARYFHTTIPSIQYLRRKYHSVKLILAKQGKKGTTKQIFDLIRSNEKILIEIARAKKIGKRLRLE